MSETEKTEEAPSTTEEQPADEAKEQPLPTSGNSYFTLIENQFLRNGFCVSRTGSAT